MTWPGVGIDRILPATASALGVPGFRDDLGLPSAPRYVVLLVDGMGEMLLREHADDAPFMASRDAVGGVHCGIPSTTATSLTSLGTGLRAGQHGVVGYTSRVPGLDRRLNTLKWDQPVDAEEWQPHPTVLQLVAEQGVPVTAVNDARFADSGLTLCSQRGVPFHGYASAWERLDLVVDAVEAAPTGLVYTYESRLDHAGHAHGAGSQEWRDVLRAIDDEVKRLRSELPHDTVLLVTADHGMINLPDGGRFDVDDHPRLREDVTMLAGEARFRHLHVVEGAAEQVAARWRTALGDRAEVRTREQALEWFGPIAPNVEGRIGDVVVAALDDFAVFSSSEFSIELLLRGFHGSITHEETSIPLLVAT